VESQSSRSQPNSVLPSSSNTNDEQALLGNVSREEFMANIDPWREPPSASGLVRFEELGGAESMSFSLRSLPRQTQRDVERAALGYAVVGTLAFCPIYFWFLWMLFQVPYLFSFDPSTWFGSGDDQPDVSLFLFIMLMIAATTLPLVRFGIWLFGIAKRWLYRLWEEAYLEAYMRMAETNLGSIFCDQKQWETAFADFIQYSIFKVIGLGSPKSPEEAIRLATAFWPFLLRYQSGEHQALVEGILDGYGTFARAGQHLFLKYEWEQYPLRARAAAMVDFLLDTPEQLPPYKDPNVKRKPHKSTSASNLKSRGYDFRLREVGDKD